MNPSDAQNAQTILAVIQVAATIILVVITGVYVYLQFRILREMETGRKLSRVTFFLVKMYCLPPDPEHSAAGKLIGQDNEIEVWNAGDAPATTVVAAVRMLNRQKARYVFPDCEIPIGNVGIGYPKKVTLPVATDQFYERVLSPSGPTSWDPT